MKKIIIGLVFIAAGIPAGAQEFTSFSRDNMVKVKTPKTNGTGTVIGYEDDYVYILTTAQVTDDAALTVTVKENRLNAKKENSPVYSNINAIPFLKDNAQNIAVIKIHKAFLQTPDITAGNHGFDVMNMSTDTTALSTKQLGLAGFAGLSEEPTMIAEKLNAYNFNKDAKYLEVESEAHAEGYAGALVRTQSTAIGMLSNNNTDAKAKALKTEAIVAYLKKNGVPHNLIKLDKLK